MFNTVANVCSIIGLAIAFWQIWKVDKKLKSTQSALTQLREAFVDQKVDVLLKAVSIQQEELLKIITNMSKQGHSEKVTQETIEKIIIELNRCNNELPEKHNEISNGLECTIKELQKAMETEDRKDYLQEAEGYLKGCIHALKKATEEGIDKRVDVIAKAY